MNFFEKNKYQIVKKAISNELASFLFDYFLLKRNAVNYMYKNNIIVENPLFGTWKDQQVPNVYSHYADFAMETLLLKILPIVMKETNFVLTPTYSYARIYEKKSILKKHKDRASCEVSSTLNLGGDQWAIYLEGIKVDLEPGDMMIYLGCELEHWREEFTGDICAQVFLHYNNINSNFKFNNKFDGREMLGVPKL